MTLSNWITIGVAFGTVAVGLSVQMILFVFWFGKFSEKVQNIKEDIEVLFGLVNNGLRAKIDAIHDTVNGVEGRVGVLESHAPIPGLLHHTQQHRSKS